MNRRKICFYCSPYPDRSSTREIMELAVKYEVGGVELMNFSDELCVPSKADFTTFGAFAREYGLTIPCFSAGTNLTGKSAEKNKEILKRYIDLVGELGIPYFHHVIAPDLTLFPPAERNDRFLRGIEAALEINAFAADYDVQTLIEEQGYIFNGVNAYAEFRKRTEGKIGCLFDTANIMFADEDPDGFLTTFLPHVKHVHVHDYRRFDQDPPIYTNYRSAKGVYLADVEIGTGDAQIPHLMQLLRDGGYRGYYALEFDQRHLSDAEIERTLALLEAEIPTA